MVTSSHCPKTSKLMSCHGMHLNERMKSLINDCSCQSLQGYCLYACSAPYSTTATAMLYSMNASIINEIISGNLLFPSTSQNLLPPVGKSV